MLIYLSLHSKQNLSISYHHWLVVVLSNELLDDIDVLSYYAYLVTWKESTYLKINSGNN